MKNTEPTQEVRNLDKVNGDDNCDQCEITSTNTKTLTWHKKSNHEGVIWKKVNGDLGAAAWLLSQEGNNSYQYENNEPTQEVRNLDKV